MHPSSKRLCDSAKPGYNEAMLVTTSTMLIDLRIDVAAIFADI
jgi:hypothetical protein